MLIVCLFFIFSGTLREEGNNSENNNTLHERNRTLGGHSGASGYSYETSLKSSTVPAPLSEQPFHTEPYNPQYPTHNKQQYAKQPATNTTHAASQGPEWGRYHSDDDEAAEAKKQSNGEGTHTRQPSYLTAMDGEEECTCGGGAGVDHVDHHAPAQPQYAQNARLTGSHAMDLLGSIPQAQTIYTNGNSVDDMVMLRSSSHTMGVNNLKRVNSLENTLSSAGTVPVSRPHSARLVTAGGAAGTGSMQDWLRRDSDEDNYGTYINRKSVQSVMNKLQHSQHSTAALHKQQPYSSSSVLPSSKPALKLDIPDSSSLGSASQKDSGYRSNASDESPNLPPQTQVYNQTNAQFHSNKDIVGKTYPYNGVSHNAPPKSTKPSIPSQKPLLPAGRTAADSRNNFQQPDVQEAKSKSVRELAKNLEKQSISAPRTPSVARKNNQTSTTSNPAGQLCFLLLFSAAIFCNCCLIDLICSSLRIIT